MLRAPLHDEGLVAYVAYWGLLSLVALSVTIRPVVDALGLPSVTENVDAALAFALAGTCSVLVLLTRDRQPRTLVALTGTWLALDLTVLLAWVAGTPSNWAGLGLGYALVLLLPSALYVVTLAVRHVAGESGVVLLRAAVVLQLVVGLWQYFHYSVADRAPFAADDVNGTTSHNFWPAFALPAALVLALLVRGRLRLLWPVAVVTLAVYAEAKAALVIWLPAIVFVGACVGVQELWRRRAAGRPLISSAEVQGIVLAVATLAVVISGLAYSPSVKGTWAVFKGHAAELDSFARDEAGVKTAAKAPTLRDAVDALVDEVPASPRTFVLGLGPGNSVSHAAEVLAQGGKGSARLPAPGPLARRMLGTDDRLQFEDAQSSLLGVWGDLGTLGALLYALSVLLAALLLVRRVLAQSGLRVVRAGSLLILLLGLLGGGFPLDWTEQAAIVLPLSLCLVVVVRAGSSTARRAPDDPAAAAGPTGTTASLAQRASVSR